jgi:ATP-dependent Clp protease ATP-binding subunit ClpA/ATP-dependent Clp protease ATP-binding subunit ClpC
VHALFPIVVEPRFTGTRERLYVAYHPFHPDAWFPLRSDTPLVESASACLSAAWKHMTEEEVLALASDRRDGIRVLAFSATPKPLEDKEKTGPFADLLKETEKKPRKGFAILGALGIDLTSMGDSARAMPRSPQREDLLALVAAPRSAIVVGPEGAGKRTLVRELVHDLLAYEDFASHQNHDLVSHVWELSGRRVLAGMSHVGEWEKRCIELAEDVRGKKIVLHFTDIHALGKLGRSRESARTLADVFRAPIERGEMVVIGTATPEAMRVLEDDAPSFAGLFAKVFLPEANPKETLEIVLHEARRIEGETNVVFRPAILRAMIELGGMLPGALPGKVLDLMQRLGRRPVEETRERKAFSYADVVDEVSAMTGLTRDIVSGKPTPRAEIVRTLDAHVMGQSRATRAVADAILRVQTQLVDSSRPRAVFLFVGPTGVGKTELAKQIASYFFYGDPSRLLRFDMGELSGPDAVARLVGDMWEPRGLLTRAVSAQPFSIVLLDEIEKAHPSVLALLLQVLDAGRLTDAAGTTASFTNTIVVMTSNLGARSRDPAGFEAPEIARDAHVHAAVRDFFPPELFNRIDEIVSFDPLDMELARSIAQKELGRLLTRSGVATRNVFVSVDPAVANRIAEHAFRSKDGARSLLRYLEDGIGAEIADELAASPAGMRLLFLRDAGERVSVERRTLVETKPRANLTFEMDRVTDPNEALQAEVKRVEAEVRPHLSLKDPRTAAIDHELGKIVDEVAPQSKNDWEDLAEDLDTDDRIVDGRTHRLMTVRKPRTARASFPSATERRPLAQQDATDLFARLVFLSQATLDPEDADEITVVIETGGTVSGAPRNLVSVLASAYMAGLPARLVELAGPDDPRPKRLALRLAGISIGRIFDLEVGTHIWDPVVQSLELAIVRVTNEPVKKAIEGPPTELLPIVRRVRFEQPPPTGPRTRVEIEDYATAFVSSGAARTFTGALEPVLLRNLTRRSRTS